MYLGGGRGPRLARLAAGSHVGRSPRPSRQPASSRRDGEAEAEPGPLAGLGLGPGVAAVEVEDLLAQVEAVVERFFIRLCA